MNRAQLLALREQRRHPMMLVMLAAVIVLQLVIVGLMHRPPQPLQVTFSPPPDARIADLRPVTVVGRRMSRGVVHVDRPRQAE